MSISVAGRYVQQPGTLSEQGRVALAFVDGGLEWLAWAAAPTSPRYDFPDETTLVAQVQLGLHGTPFALLKQLRLMVSPVKLMTLAPPDLRVLARSESEDDTALLTAQVKRVFSVHQLLDQDALDGTRPFLAELNVLDAPVFQSMDFMDRVALARLMGDPLLAPTAAAAATSTAAPAAPANAVAPIAPLARESRAARTRAGSNITSNSGNDNGGQALRAEAAAFAVEQSRSPQEFADYLRFYLALASRPSAAGLSAGERQQRAVDALQTLLPLFFGALDCPQVSGLPSPQEVGQAVSTWLSSGKQVGFSRLSEGVVQLVLHGNYQGETGADAKRLVDRYMSSAQSLLAAVRPTRGLMGQDGSTCVFPLSSGGQRAELLISGNGVISLREFGAAQKPAAAAPTSPSDTSSDPENTP
ncbi:hypothetical protein DBR42_18695 [Pelomonas sp. HMWF004]|nr:hypothetical protein DBR42_18695 [Pelomonas sp. HMWF004]